MEKIKKKSKGDIGELIFYISIIALPLLQVLIFYFVVNFNSILMAFQKYKVTRGFYFDLSDLGVNFVKIWADVKSGLLLVALKNSLVVWFFVSIVGTFLSILFSYYIFKKWFLAKTFKFILFLPAVLPSVMLVLVYKIFVNQGIPYYLEQQGKIITPFLLDKNLIMPTVIFFNVWTCFGAQLLIYTGAMGQISPDILEAGQVDGVTNTREFFSIVIPIILPTVATFMIANVATIFTNQANLYAFYSSSLDNQYMTLGYYLYHLVADFPEKSMYNYASALGIVCTFIAFPLTLIAKKILNRGGEL